MALGYKRKRAEVCYAEVPEDDESSGLLSTEEVSPKHKDDDESDIDLPLDDSWYGPKRTSKRSKRRKTVGKRSTSKKAEKPFPFLSLPPELRDYIYELALTEPAGVTLIHRHKGFRRSVCRGEVLQEDLNAFSNLHYCRYPDGGNYPVKPPIAQRRSLIPNLLAVNHQIRDEAVGYLYKQPIILESSKALHVFLTNIGHANRLVLSHVVLKAWGHGRGVEKAMNFAALDMLSDCINLKVLHLDCPITIWGRRLPAALARAIYSNGYAFLQSLGHARGKKCAALDILKLNKVNYQHVDDGFYGGLRPKPPVLEPDEFEKQFIGDLRGLILGKSST